MLSVTGTHWDTLAHRLGNAYRDFGLGIRQYISYVYSSLKLTNLLVVSIIK